MTEKKDILDIFRIGLILLTITAISAGILACLNKLTAPVIEHNAELRRNMAMSKVLPSAKDFEKIEYMDESSVVSVYKGEDKGYVVLAEPNGYGGTISLVVGVDNDGIVTGVEVTSQSETPGLGASCTQDEFKDRFIGKKEGITVVKYGAGENQIDAISSATITSKAVTKGVNDAISAVYAINGEEDSAK